MQWDDYSDYQRFILQQHTQGFVTAKEWCSWVSRENYGIDTSYEVNWKPLDRPLRFHPNVNERLSAHLDKQSGSLIELLQTVGECVNQSFYYAPVRLCMHMDRCSSYKKVSDYYMSLAEQPQRPEQIIAGTCDDAGLIIRELLFDLGFLPPNIHMRSLSMRQPLPTEYQTNIRKNHWHNIVGIALPEQQEWVLLNTYTPRNSHVILPVETITDLDDLKKTDITKSSLQSNSGVRRV